MSAEPKAAANPDRMTLANPGSIYEQFERDRERKDHIFQVPGVDLVTEPWSDFRTELDEKFGFRPAFSFTHIYQWASDTVGLKEQGSAYELNLNATWTVFGRKTESPTMVGFEFLYNQKIGTDIPPTALYTQIGSVYPTTIAFDDIDPSVGQLWLQQIIADRFGLRIGKYYPLDAYDFFPLKNFRMDFVDGVQSANLVIPLPDRGLGGFAEYRPEPNIYVRAGLHDANADTEKTGFSSLFNNGDLFKILEVGIDPGFVERIPGRAPSGDIHATFWQQDKRNDDNIDKAWGFAFSASQRIGRLMPFIRYGYSDGGRFGPTPMSHVVNLGVAIDGIFDQSNDRIGIGLSWSHPANGDLDDQGAVDTFYHIQVTPQIAVTPSVQVILNPALYPNKDAVWVLGIRSRFNF
ncbi:MAG: carbohydrate porin [Deltaproteobacteria bacterium]|nr:carbohydrate porin [Deltaproteobacteria bacterium]